MPAGDRRRCADRLDHPGLVCFTAIRLTSAGVGSTASARSSASKVDPAVGADRHGLHGRPVGDTRGQDAVVLHRRGQHPRPADPGDHRRIRLGRAAP